MLERRLKVLLSKIRVRINQKMGGEVSLDMPTLCLLFPIYYKALVKIASLGITPQEFTPEGHYDVELDLDPRRYDAYTIRKSGVTLYKAGGGRYVRKQNLRPKFQGKAS